MSSEAATLPDAEPDGEAGPIDALDDYGVTETADVEPTAAGEDEEDAAATEAGDALTEAAPEPDATDEAGGGTDEEDKADVIPASDDLPPAEEDAALLATQVESCDLDHNHEDDGSVDASVESSRDRAEPAENGHGPGADFSMPPRQTNGSHVDPTAEEGDRECRRIDMEGENEDDATAAAEAAAAVVDTVREADMSPTRRRKHTLEDDTCESWRRRQKHLFMLSNAGKPIYSRYGDENRLSGFMAIIQAMVSFVEDGGDNLRWIRAGKHLFVFRICGPLYLVAVACTGEPVEVLDMQLRLFYDQVISILTDGVAKAFKKNATFDMRTLLGGTESVLGNLVRSFSRDLRPLLSSYRCLYLEASARNRVTEHITRLKAAGLRHGLLLSGSEVVSLVHSKKYDLCSEDILLLINFVRSSESLKSNPESFTPFCFPSQNAGAFLYIYVSFLIKDVALVLVTTQGDSFFDLSQCKKELEENLRMDGLLDEILAPKPVLSSVRILQNSGGASAPLLHFAFRDISRGQLVSSMPSLPLHTDKQRKWLIRSYQRLVATCKMQSAWTVANANGAGANAPTNGYKSTTLCSQMQYRMSHHVGHIAWLTHEFEMYTTFDPLTQKEVAVERCNELRSWIRAHESEYLFTPAVFLH